MSDIADRPKRNDLPARAAKRVIDTLFPEDFRIGDPIIEAYRCKLEKDISRAIWNEMLLLEGEINLGVAK